VYIAGDRHVNIRYSVSFQISSQAAIVVSIGDRFM
jgi:hypothetical protein